MTEINRSPFLIRMMFVCYYSPEPQEEFGQSWRSEVGRESLAWLKEEGLIDDNNEATSRGKAWVEFIINTPLPEAKWVLPERSEQ